MLKQIVVLLLVAVCLVSCQDREREKTMAEIERLDLLRKKINEFLLGQKASFLSKNREYTEWKSGHLANLTKYQKVITEAEKEEKLTKINLWAARELLKNLKSKMSHSPAEIDSFFYRTHSSRAKRFQNKLNALEKLLSGFREEEGITKKAIAEKEPIFLKQIETLESDLKISQATYDSLNALHTVEVGKLARFGSEQ